MLLPFRNTLLPYSQPASSHVFQNRPLLFAFSPNLISIIIIIIIDIINININTTLQPNNLPHNPQN